MNNLSTTKSQIECLQERCGYPSEGYEIATSGPKGQALRPHRNDNVHKIKFGRVLVHIEIVKVDGRCITAAEIQDNLVNASIDPYRKPCGGPGVPVGQRGE